MNAAYVGILTDGSTSRMRAEWLRRLTPGWSWTWVDTDPPMATSGKVWRSLAFRAKLGTALTRINEEVIRGIDSRSFDLIWVDKGVFLRPATVIAMRRSARKLIHYTPDTAFHANRSRHFERTADLYDLLVTTKSFEMETYSAHVARDKIVLTTQGYDGDVHFPRSGDAQRRREAVFIGLAEPDRVRCVRTLLEHGVPVRLGGFGWGRLLRRWHGSPLLMFEGEQIFGAAYSSLLSGSWVGLGLLSRRFPELHTTRTFEIPACGAVLATPMTSETASFFTPREAVFFADYADLAQQLATLLHEDSDERLRAMADAGRRRVVADGRDYEKILAAILAEPRVAV